MNGKGNTEWIRFVGRPWHGEHNEVPERDVSSGLFHNAAGEAVARPLLYRSGGRVEAPRRHH